MCGEYLAVIGFHLGFRADGHCAAGNGGADARTTGSVETIPATGPIFLGSLLRSYLSFAWSKVRNIASSGLHSTDPFDGDTTLASVSSS